MPHCHTLKEEEKKAGGTRVAAGSRMHADAVVRCCTEALSASGDAADLSESHTSLIPKTVGRLLSNGRVLRIDCSGQ